ncbi:MAG: inositol 2-dehydrogenase [Flavobacteriaceae bacterium]|nr:inositol 2-dehydrogenase [Flavobacteriaceae bacterium]
MKMDKIKLGVIGAGRIGKIHIENIYSLNENIEINGVVTNNEETINWLEKYGITQIYKNANDLIKNDRINTIIICSPSSFHYDQIKLAASLKKNIFCEKPMDLDLNNVIKLDQIIKKSKIKFMLGFNRRFDPNFKKVKKNIVEGKIGFPKIIKITSRDPNPPNLSYLKNSGGIFLDMSIHDFDIARYLIDEEVVSVFSSGYTFYDNKINEFNDIDTAITTLNFKNGTMAVIDNCRKVSYGYDQRVEVLGSKGLTGCNNKLHNDSYLFNSNGSHFELPMDFFIDRYSESYVNEIKYFIKCLKNNMNIELNSRDGILSTAIAFAAKKSLKEKRLVEIREIINL